MSGGPPSPQDRERALRQIPDVHARHDAILARRQRSAASLLPASAGAEHQVATTPRLSAAWAPRDKAVRSAIARIVAPRPSRAATVLAVCALPLRPPGRITRS